MLKAAIAIGTAPRHFVRVLYNRGIATWTALWRLIWMAVVRPFMAVYSNHFWNDVAPLFDADIVARADIFSLKLFNS